MGARARVDLAAMAALGAGVVAVAAWTATWAASRDHAGAFAAALLAGLVVWAAAGAWVIRRRPAGWGALALVVAVGLGARLALVGHAPDVSGDVNRYVWDGRVQAEGVNPYRYPPDHPRLAALRDDEVYPGINRKPVTTIYPPAAEAAFLGLHVAGADDVTRLKLAFALVDALATVLLGLLLWRLGQAPSRAALYAWHPLGIMEVGRSGHVDALAVALLLAALLAHAARRPLASGALLAGAALAKLYAAAALPALLWVRGRRAPVAAAAFAATALLLYLPYLGVGAGVLGYLPGYLGEEGYGSGRRYHLLARLQAAAGGDLSIGPVGAAAWYPAAAALAVGFVAARLVLRPPGSPRAGADRALLMLLLPMLLTTPTYPWYLLLPLAVMPAASARLAVPAAIAGAGAGFLYLQWWLPSNPSWPLDVTWGLSLAALVLPAAAGAVRRALCRRGGGEDERHPRAALGPGLRPDPAALGLDETAGDGQAQAGAGAVRSAGRVRAPEAVEGAVEELGGDAGARVLDADARPS
jgi:hypothetical protein